MVVKRYTLLAIVLCLVLAMTLTSGAVTEDVPLTQSEPVVNFDAQGPQTAPLMDEVLEDTIVVEDSIQTAIESVSAGGTVIVPDGEYNENITIRKSIKLVSQNGAEETVIYGSIVVLDGTANVTIGEAGKGFTIVGARGRDSAVNLLGDVTGCIIQGNTIVAGEDSYGLVTNGSQSNHLITGNTFVNCADETPKELVNIGERLDGSSLVTNVVVSNNEFLGKAEIALVMNAKGSAVTGNIFETNCFRARLVLKVAGLTVTNNHFVSLVDDYFNRGLQLLDGTGSYNLEVLRKANQMDQAVYLEGGHQIYYYIQNAVDDAIDGDKVLVGAGDYTEQVYVRKDRISLISLDSTDGVYAANIILPDNAYPVEQLEPLAAELLAEIPQIDVPDAQKVISLDNAALAQMQLQFTSKFPELNRAGFNVHSLPYALVLRYSSVTVEGFNIDGMYGMGIWDSKFFNNKFDGEEIGAFLERGFSDQYPDFKAIQFVDNLFTGNLWGGLLVEHSENLYLNKNVFTLNGTDPTTCPCRPGTLGFGAAVLRSVNVTVADNEFNDNTLAGLYLDSLRQTDGSQLIIRYNEFDLNDVGGLFINNCHDILVEANESFYKNGLFGFACIFSEDLVMQQNGRVSENGRTAYGYGFGVGVLAVTDVEITNNKEIFNNLYDGILALGVAGDFDITENKIYENGANGITGYACVPVDISDNEILDNGAHGISLFVTPSTIKDNLIEDNEDAGVDLTAGSFATIENNDILENGIGINMDVYSVFASFELKTTVHFNNIIDNTHGLVVYRPALPSATLSERHDVDWNDYGLFSLNFWGDVSGPYDEDQRAFADIQADVWPYKLGNLLGTCNDVQLPNDDFHRSISVRTYTPWLSKDYRTVGQGGGAEPVIPYAVGKGWNFISMPKILGVDKWNDIADIGNGLNASEVYGYENGAWVSFGSASFKFNPLESYYIKMNDVDFIPVVLKVTGTAPSGVPAMRELSAGWNMVAPALENKEGDAISNVLASVEQTPAGLPGWIYVIHPEMAHRYGEYQNDFAFSKNDNEINYTQMINYAGYWVYLQNDATLAGQATTFWWDDLNGNFRSLLDRMLNVREVL